jgi:predicted N-acetyltransferase YhbS
MNTLLIRSRQLNDIPQILEIRKRTFLHFTPSAYSPKEVKTLVEDINIAELEEMIANKSVFVAEENHEILGCGGWFGEDIRYRYVSPEETKKGIGTSLLRVLEEDYKNRTHSSIIKAGTLLLLTQYCQIKSDTAKRV